MTGRACLLAPLFALLALFAWAGAALAQSCSFSVTDVNFGNVDTLAGGAVDATATVSVTCSALLAPVLPVRVCLNLNQGSGGATGATRHMRNSLSEPLDFNIYQDAARTVPWGSREQPALGNPVSLIFNTILLGAPQTQTVTMYARLMPGQQDTRPGLYSSVFSGAQISFNYVVSLLLPANCSNVTQNTNRPTINVVANVIPNCLVTAQNINFGNHGVLDSAVDATGGLNVTCTPGTDYTVALDNGQTGTGPTARRMTRGAQAVVYGLYQDAARTTPWGATGGQRRSGTGTGATQNVPVYGRVPPQQTPSPGNYTDTVVVTVSY